MKSLSANYIAKLDAQENKPRLLYEIVLDSGTLYLADDITNITFPTAGQVYTALGVQHEMMQIGGSEVIDTVQVAIDNVDDVLGRYVVYEPFRGRALIIKRVFADLLSAGADVEILFAGVMMEPIVDQYKITVEAIAGQILKRKVPQESYSRQCRWQLGDSVTCQKDISGYEVEEANAPDSGSTTTLVDSNLINTIDDLYIEGVLECDFTSGAFTWTEKRRISEYNKTTKTITVALPFSRSTAGAGRWKAIAGCNKTWTICHNRYVNLMNFGGFIHVR